jgi:hypothetical protein
VFIIVKFDYFEGFGHSAGDALRSGCFFCVSYRKCNWDLLEEIISICVLKRVS